MIAKRMKRALRIVILATTVAMSTGATCAQATVAPIKEILTSSIGWEVGEHGGKVCLLAAETCQRARASHEPGGFEYPHGVTGAPNGNVYVADTGNHRVQELESDGKFVLMFGREVNETAHLNGETSNEDVCPAKAGDKCKQGVEESAPGQFSSPEGVTTDPASGDVYVAEVVYGRNGTGELTFGERVQKFTASGAFVLEIGKDVNETAHLNRETANENVCPIKIGDKCQGPAQRLAGTTYEWGGEHGAFAEPRALAVGPNPAKPSENLLYVGDEHRVQEFAANGTWVGEIRQSLEAISSGQGAQVSTLTVDPAGDVYLVYEVNFVVNTIREFDPSGSEIRKFQQAPREPGAGLGVGQIELGAGGRLVMTESEAPNGPNQATINRGVVYDVGVSELKVSTEFPRPYSVQSVTFNGNDELYVLSNDEVLRYVPKPVAQLVAGLATCATGSDRETDATVTCTVNGQVDPWGVKETQIWYGWGRTISLGEQTALQAITDEKPNEGEEEALVDVSAQLEGLRPNELYYYKLTGLDHNVKSPEQLTSGNALSLTTPLAAPLIVARPTVSFVHPSSAVMFGEVNPENAHTEYLFEYAPELQAGKNPFSKCPNGVRSEACQGVSTTPTRQAATYGVVGTTAEATGLRSGTTYHYRLFAEDESRFSKGEKRASRLEAAQEGTFTTALAPRPEAQTGTADMIGSTSAVVSGSVDPDGEPAAYAFEVGIYNGASTRYGNVFSGSAGEGDVPIEETLALTGLQPGTTYAYRIKVESSYGTAYGATVTFTTAGLPSVLVVPRVLAQLSVPNIGFPRESGKAKSKKLTRAQQIANALKACKKKTRNKRSSCERAARNKYGVKPQKKK